MIVMMIMIAATMMTIQGLSEASNGLGELAAGSEEAEERCFIITIIVIIIVILLIITILKNANFNQFQQQVLHCKASEPEPWEISERQEKESATTTTTTTTTSTTTTSEQPQLTDI